MSNSLSKNGGDNSKKDTARKSTMLRVAVVTWQYGCHSTSKQVRFFAEHLQQLPVVSLPSSRSNA
jgi:hypothetical protein